MYKGQVFYYYDYDKMPGDLSELQPKQIFETLYVISTLFASPKNRTK